MGFVKTCDEHDFFGYFVRVVFHSKYPQTVSKLHSNIMQNIFVYSLLFLHTLPISLQVWIDHWLCNFIYIFASLKIRFSRKATQNGRNLSLSWHLSNLKKKHPPLGDFQTWVTFSEYLNFIYLFFVIKICKPCPWNCSPYYL